jgi:copper chaperone CopZ
VVTSIPDPAGPGPSEATVAELRVEGMHCGSCVALVEESLTEQPGVTSASVDLESARAVVEYDSSVIGPDQLRAAVADAGYSAAMVG